MKRKFLRYMAGTISLVALFGSAYAYNEGAAVPAKGVPSKIYVFDALKAEGATLITDKADINARALKEFSKTFKAITNASWYETQDGGFIAKFTLDGIETRVNYDRKGKWTGTIRSYMEDKLPKDIRHIVKSVYYDYTIYYAQEVTVAAGTAYLVKIEDATSLKTIRVVNGEMDEYESYKKAL